jgi:hypothetical protein
LEIKGISSTTGSVHAAVRRIKDTTGSEGTTNGAAVSVTFDALASVGEFRDELVIQTNSDEGGTVTIPITAKVVPRLRLSPESIFFGRAKAGDVAASRVRLLTALQGVKVGVRADPSLKDLIGTEVVEVAPGREWEIVARVQEGAPQGVFQGHIFLETTLPEAGSVSVPISGSVVGHSAAMKSRGPAIEREGGEEVVRPGNVGRDARVSR